MSALKASGSKPMWLLQMCIKAPHHKAVRKRKLSLSKQKQQNHCGTHSRLLVFSIQCQQSLLSLMCTCVLITGMAYFWSDHRHWLAVVSWRQAVRRYRISMVNLFLHLRSSLSAKAPITRVAEAWECEHRHSCIDMPAMHRSRNKNPCQKEFGRHNSGARVSAAMPKIPNDSPSLFHSFQHASLSRDLGVGQPISTLC